MKPLKTSILLFTFCVHVNSVALAAEPYKIALSEIQMLPAHTNDPVRIELVNCSAERIAMTGWYMTDGYGHRYDFPKALKVPKGALVVVSFGSEQEKNKDDLDFSDNVAYLYCKEPWSQNAFRGMKNECTVYAPSDDGEKSGTVHDYLLWGSWRIESEAHKQAAAKKLWILGDAAFPGDEMQPGWCPMQPGWSLARIDFQLQRRMSRAWFVNALCDVSLGVLNSWPIPRPICPMDKDRFELSNLQLFSWDATCGTNDTFLIQISRNKDFTDILFEKVTPDQSIRHTIEEGTYYWRVCINAPEPNRKWSRIAEFSVEDRSKRRDWKPGDPRIRFKGKDYDNKEPKPAQ